MGINSECFFHFFKKPATRRYPKEKIVPEERFRGKIEFVAKNCTGCKLCVASCPAFAIKFKAKGDLEFDMGKCIFCGLCVETCKFNAIKFCKDFEYSSKDLKDFVVGRNK